MNNPFFSPDFNLISQVSQMPNRRKMTPAQLSQMLQLQNELKKGVKGRDEGMQKSIDTVGQIKALGEQEAGLYSDTPVHKIPQREGPSKGAMNLGLILGGLGALTNDPNAANYTANVLGGAKARADETYQDEMGRVAQMKEDDERSLMRKVSALRAKQSGLGAELDLTGKQMDIYGRQAEVASAGIEGIGRDVQNQSNIDRGFFSDQMQRTITNKLNQNADVRAQSAEERAADEWKLDRIIKGANATWVPLILEKEFGMKETASKVAVEELKQLETKGKYLEPTLRLQTAEMALSMSNTRQIMSERALQIQAIKDGKLSGDLTELGKLQLQDALKQVDDYNALISKWEEQWSLNSGDDDASKKSAEAAKQLVSFYQQQRNKAKAAVKALSPGFYGK